MPLQPPRFAADFMHNNDPYFRNNPGHGLKKITSYKFDIYKDFEKCKAWRTNDGRILPNSESSFNILEIPFDNENLILLKIFVNPSLANRLFGGFGMRIPVNPAINIDNHTFVEFDLYYSRDAADKYMRFEIWSTSTNGEGNQADSGERGSNKTQVNIRTADLEGIQTYNIDYRAGYYNEETWFKKTIIAAVPVSAGTWEYINIDLHTETNTKVSGGLLMLGNIRITKTDPNGIPINKIVNTKKFIEVEPVRNKYNPANGYFLIGTDGAGTIAPDTLGGYHYELYVSHRNLKPERHVKPPEWLINEFPDFSFTYEDEKHEWDLPTEYYLNIRDAGDYKLHGHCLAWINQSPHWLNQIMPENAVSLQWDSNRLFHTKGYYEVNTFIKVKKETARRVYYNHILYEMRHFMTCDARYNSSKERGIIPFHSFDVVNSEVHESRHGVLIKKDPNEWKNSLKHTSWLMAMTDNELDDIRQNYIYLLYKFAHIAVPNTQMAKKYKENFNNPDIIPEYMKMDNHDNNGSIDEFINDKPPLLIYNDYEVVANSKAKVIYNMTKELNAAWKTDPLYDGRNLIECIGIQGHDTVSPLLASQNMQVITLFAGLINEGLLDKICYSEIDIKQPDSAPGGRARAPDVLNEKQADVIGYQYALLFKLFDKFKKYIDHVTIWNQSGSGWQNSYVLFDHEQMASQAYYAVMDPDKFIKGHSYLDSYFSGEYNKINKIITR
ncbi:MAG: endo-1,4-beta-xylanase [Treponema sp.]|nr:endo-1,4-beta-xylanase [Treponema sp.]